MLLTTVFFPPPPPSLPLCLTHTHSKNILGNLYKGMNASCPYTDLLEYS